MSDQPVGAESWFEVDADGHGRRLDLYLAGRAPAVSRAKLQKLIAAGAVLVNDRPVRAKDLLATGDRVRVRWPPAPPVALEPVAMPLAILYEDDAVIVLDKPAGLTVHPGAGTKEPTLVAGLLHHCGHLGAPARFRAPGAVEDPTAWTRPGIVHRLDRDTSGVLVCAKTDRAHAHLTRQFHDKVRLQREYLALLDGTLAAEAVTHTSWLYRDPVNRLKFSSLSCADYSARLAAAPRRDGGPLPGMRWARSHFYRQAVFGQRLTLARVRLDTGRTHQIRLHALDLRAPVVGDPLYHRPTQLPLGFSLEVRRQLAAVRRQLLHARLLVFEHPNTGEVMRFETPPPEDFAAILRLLGA